MAGHTNPPSVSGSGVLPIAATVLGLQNLRRQLFSRPFKGHDFGPMKAAGRQSSGATTVSRIFPTILTNSVRAEAEFTTIHAS